MTETQLGQILLGTLLLSPLLGRLAGWVTRRSLSVSPGDIASQMPGLPARAEAKGEPGTRCEARVQQCEARVQQCEARVQQCEARVLRAMGRQSGPFEGVYL